jgi:hypothetical protein
MAYLQTQFNGKSLLLSPYVIQALYVCKQCKRIWGLLYHNISMKKLMANLGNDIEDKHNTLY